MVTSKRFWLTITILMAIAGCDWLDGDDSSDQTGDAYVTDGRILDSGGGDDTTVSKTWVDPATGYEWQVNPGSPCTWQDAVDYCQSLGNGWRMPTIGELRTLVRGCPDMEPGGLVK